MRRTTLALIYALAAGAGACDSAGGRPEAAVDMTAPAADLDEAKSLGQGADGYAGRSVAPSAPPSPAPASASAQLPAGIPSMVIRTGTASVEVDSLEPAIAAVRRLVARAGGYVGNTSLQAGHESVRSATLELRVPADRFEEVVAGLSPVGEVDYVNVAAEDVTEQYVDLEARAENAKRLEGRLAELLATRTGKLDDVLAVERELARVREEIERLEGRMRYLRSRADLSSLTVSLHEPGPLVGVPGDHPLRDALRQAWRNAVMFAAWLIAASGVLIPLAVLAGTGLLLVRRFRRARVAAA